MNTRYFFVHGLLVCLVSVLLITAQDTLFANDESAVPPPKGEHCVEPTEVMRKKHFEFILHQRDETVLHGIRTKKYSFKGCIDCHITPDENGEYARYSEPDKHFCAHCHEYAAVDIDCFECHADRPEKAIRATIKDRLTSQQNIRSPKDIDVELLANTNL
jgi:hypothetical protein